MKLKSFLNKYDTVIFDLDGVITSEQNYWDAAAFTVVEYLAQNSGEKIDIKKWSKKKSEIRNYVFSDDELIGILKGKGVNSNWDLGYVTVLMAWICGGKERWDCFDEVLQYAKTLSDNILDEYDRLAKTCSKKTDFDYEWLKRNGLMWNTMRDLFQTWFLGDKLFEEIYGFEPVNTGKIGLLYEEEPLIDKDKLVKIMQLLSANKRLCTGTGRPKAEMLPPLESWGIKQYFAKDGLCNYDDVVTAENEIDGATLTKPHPYMFLKALYGTDYSNQSIVDGNYDNEKIKTTLVVGDAGADILASQAMGADFCATLTGVAGKAAKSYFEELGATYIVDSLEDFLTEE